MAATYVSGGADRISRIRFDCLDTDTTAPKIQDEEYGTILDNSLSPEFVALYIPNNTSGVTAAKAKVTVVSSVLTLTLTKNTTATAITLAPNGGRIEDVVDLIQAIGGWQVGLGVGTRLEWVPIGIVNRSWRASVEVGRALTRFGRSADMALFTETACFTDGETYVKLRLYQYAVAAFKALERIYATDGELGYTSMSDGDISRRRERITNRMERIASKASYGIYAE